MYVQFIKLNNSFHDSMGNFKSQSNKHNIHTTREWVMFEVEFFYLYLLSSAVFLFYIQLRGQCGKASSKEARDARKERNLQDPLDFYSEDIYWFSFSFIMIFVHFLVVTSAIFESKKSERA